MKQQTSKKEKGAAVVEYIIIIGGTLLLSVGALQYLGSTTSDRLDVFASGKCPNGWNLIPNGQTKKNGQNVDANGDGLICRKDIPGKGKGNTNQNQNIKDNN